MSGASYTVIAGLLADGSLVHATPRTETKVWLLTADISW